MAAWMVAMEGLRPTLGTTSSTATSKKGMPEPSAPAAPPRRRLPRALKLALVAADIACTAHAYFSMRGQNWMHRNSTGRVHTMSTRLTGYQK